MYSDEYLVKQAQNGNMGAFTELLEKYDRHVLNIAYSFRNNEDDAKDIYQEVFLRVFRSLKNFENRSEFSTWLYRITTNVCITFNSKKERQKMESLDKPIYNGEEDSGKLSDSIAGFEPTNKNLENDELAKQITYAVNKLPPQQKLAFTLKHYQELKITEIADMMNCKEGTVKRYLFNATNKMKEQLAAVLS